MKLKRMHQCAIVNLLIALCLLPLQIGVAKIVSRNVYFSSLLIGGATETVLFFYRHLTQILFFVVLEF